MRFVLAFILTTAALGANARQPNVVVILADDLGWSDLGCYGNKYVDTPNLDRLAQQGMRFTDAYAPAPICSASRAALLTGQSPARLHIEFVTKPDGSKVPPGTILRQPDYPRDLPLEALTIAESLPTSYVSGFFGKWHLTQECDTYLGWGKTMGPLQQGFTDGTEHRGSHPYGYTKEEKKSVTIYRKGEYPVDSLAMKAISFLQSNKQKPFLLYYSMYYVHDPVQTRCQWLKDKYSERLGPGTKEDYIQYAAFLETMDAQAGQLLKALDDLELSKNTVVFFLSDNGGHPRYTRTPLHGSKWNLYEGGIRVPMIVRWPGVVKGGTISSDPVIGTDLFPAIMNLTAEPQESIRHTDGMSLLPILREPGKKFNRDRVITWHFPYYHPEFVNTKPQSAIREGNYKLIYFYEDERTELYDLAKDRNERHDLSRQLPKVNSRMKENLLSSLKASRARFPVKL